MASGVDQKARSFLGFFKRERCSGEVLKLQENQIRVALMERLGKHWLMDMTDRHIGCMLGENDRESSLTLLVHKSAESLVCIEGLAAEKSEGHPFEHTLVRTCKLVQNKRERVVQLFPRQLKYLPHSQIGNSSHYYSQILVWEFCSDIDSTNNTLPSATPGAFTRSLPVVSLPAGYGSVCGPWFSRWHNSNVAARYHTAKQKVTYVYRCSQAINADMH